MSKSMLTQKQENFCLNIVSGMSATDAALSAGYAPKYAQENCSKLLVLTRIQDRLGELRKSRVKSTIATVEERQERLTTFIREDIQGRFGITRHSNIAAIAEHNKMDGSYAPVRTDHTFNGEGLSQILNKLRGYNPQLEEGKSDATEEV